MLHDIQMCNDDPINDEISTFRSNITKFSVRFGSNSSCVSELTWETEVEFQSFLDDYSAQHGKE